MGRLPRSGWRWASIRRPAPFSWRTPPPRAASARSTPARSRGSGSRTPGRHRPPRPARHGRGNAVFGRERAHATPGTAGRVVPLAPDRSLVQAAQADPAQFDPLYRKYLAQVYSFAHHELGDHHEAEDVTERTFMLALGALPRFRDAAPDDAGPEASTFRVWLFRIARNVISNHRRAARRRPTAPLEAAAGMASPEDVEGRAVARAEASAAWAA